MSIKRHQIKQIVGRKIRIGNEIILKIMEVSKPGERMQLKLGIEEPEVISIIPMEYYSERVKAMQAKINHLKEAVQSRVMPQFFMKKKVFLRQENGCSTANPNKPGLKMRKKKMVNNQTESLHQLIHRYQRLLKMYQRLSQTALDAKRDKKMMRQQTAEVLACDAYEKLSHLAHTIKHHYPQFKFTEKNHA